MGLFLGEGNAFMPPEAGLMRLGCNVKGSVAGQEENLGEVAGFTW